MQTSTEAPPKDPQVPPAAACEDGYFWESTKKYRDYHKGVGATQSNYNGTSRTAKYGVYRLKSAGYSQYHYANCTKGVKHNATLYTPHRIGWYILETK